MQKLLGFVLGFIGLFSGMTTVFADDYIVKDINSFGNHNTINVIIEKLNDINSDAILIVADYTRDESLKQINTIPLCDIPLGEHTFNTSICLTPPSYKGVTYDEIKVFIWNNIYTMTPLCLSETRIIEEHYDGGGGSGGSSGSIATHTNSTSNTY